MIHIAKIQGTAIKVCELFIQCTFSTDNINQFVTLYFHNSPDTNECKDLPSFVHTVLHFSRVKHVIVLWRANDISDSFTVTTTLCSMLYIGASKPRGNDTGNVGGKVKDATARCIFETHRCVKMRSAPAESRGTL